MTLRIERWVRQGIVVLTLSALFKLCGNFMISSMLETLGEAQALIRKAGLEPNEFVQLMAEF